MAREDDGGGAAGAPALDDGFFMVNAQPSRVPSVLAARMTWVGVGQLRQRPTVWGVRVPEGSRGIVECIQSAPLGATGPRRHIHTSPPIPRRETGKEGLKGEQTRRREMIILLGEWRKKGTTEVRLLSVYLCYLRTDMHRITSENWFISG